MQLFPVKLFLTILCQVDRRLEHIMISWMILFQFGTSEYSKHSEVSELAFHMYTVNPLKRETCSFLPPEITHACLWNLVWVRDAVEVWSTGTEQGVMSDVLLKEELKGFYGSKHSSVATLTLVLVPAAFFRKTNLLYLDLFFAQNKHFKHPSKKIHILQCLLLIIHLTCHFKFRVVSDNKDNRKL